MKKFFSLFFFGFLFVGLFSPVHAEDECTDCNIQDEMLKAEITSISEDKCSVFDEEAYAESDSDCMLVLTKGLEGEHEGKVMEVLVDVSANAEISTVDFRVGDKVWLNKSTLEDTTIYSIAQLDRTSGIIWLVAIFVVLVVVVGRLQGVTSLVGMVVSVFAIFGVVVPAILAGKDPVLFGTLAGMVIMLVSIYLSHGFNKKTTISLVGTIITLVVTILLALLFSSVLRLTGFGDEEAFFLVQQADVSISMSKVLIASIILGSIGILDDVTVSQVAIIQTLKEENPGLTAKDLFLKSMNVGKDHIASMVNTLFLVYAGSSLPMVLLLRISDVSLGQIIHFEEFAQEIVRTVVGSIGLVLAVPITSLIAAESYAKHEK